MPGLLYSSLGTARDAVYRMLKDLKILLLSEKKVTFTSLWIPISFFSLKTCGAAIFHFCQDCLLIGQIHWKGVPGTLGTRHAGSVLFAAPTELQNYGLEMGIELRSPTWQDKAQHLTWHKDRALKVKTKHVSKGATTERVACRKVLMILFL